LNLILIIQNQFLILFFFVISGKSSLMRVAPDLFPTSSSLDLLTSEDSLSTPISQIPNTNIHDNLANTFTIRSQLPQLLPSHPIIITPSHHHHHIIITLSSHHHHHHHTGVWALNSAIRSRTTRHPLQP